jgi:hypothetical protein
MDYAVPDRRASKNDKRAKGRFMRYKRGGRARTSASPVISRSLTATFL